MKKQNNQQRELPDFLEEMRDQNPFITPHNYFRELPDQIMQRLHQESKQTRKLSILQSLRFWIRTLYLPQPAWALALIVVVAAVFFFDRTIPTASVSVGQDISVEEIATYVQANIDDFDDLDFYVQETADVDLLGESFESEEFESLMDGLMDEVDLETIQRIL